VSGRPAHLECSFGYTNPERGTTKAAVLSRHGNRDGGVLGSLADFPQANAAGDGVPDGLLEGSLPPCPRIGAAFRALAVRKAAHGNWSVAHVSRGDAGHQQPKIPDVPRVIAMADEVGHRWIERRTAW